MSAKKYVIMKNSIRCNLCGDVIESTFRHDYVACSCGACAVDGGHDYLRRAYSDETVFTEISVVSEAPLTPKTPD